MSQLDGALDLVRKMDRRTRFRRILRALLRARRHRLECWAPWTKNREGVDRSGVPGLAQCCIAPRRELAREPAAAVCTTLDFRHIAARRHCLSCSAATTLRGVRRKRDAFSMRRTPVASSCPADGGSSGSSSRLGVTQDRLTVDDSASTTREQVGTIAIWAAQCGARRFIVIASTLSMPRIAAPVHSSATPTVLAESPLDAAPASWKSPLRCRVFGPCVPAATRYTGHFAFAYYPRFKWIPRPNAVRHDSHVSAAW
jgi:hypothetical protein